MEIHVDNTMESREIRSSASISSTSTAISDVKVKLIGSYSNTELKSRETRSSASVSSTSTNMSDVEVKLIGSYSNTESFNSTSSVDLDRNAEHRHLSSRGKKLTFDDLNFMQRLGNGDIGTVYLVELKGGGGGGGYFAAKVMDKEELAYRNKESRAGVEREILQMLDHPFCPSLFATLDCPKWSCLLTEFCPGGDLHVLRQHQPEKRFDVDAVRFYASEVVAALEYLHMLGIIYRDLKPENILVRSDGHIMLTDFDLSMKCNNSTSKAQLVYDAGKPHRHSSEKDPTTFSISSCILPRCMVPHAWHRRMKKKKGALKIVAEPVDARSMSFVGTHEYLAPEIVSGEGHGNAVDWWTLGVFMYELFYGVTPFRGRDHECTLANIVAHGLEFPREPVVGAAAKDLMSQLLEKEPSKRMGSVLGAAAIKHHPFFEGVNWALLRCNKPPFLPPKSFDTSGFNYCDADFDCF